MTVKCPTRGDCIHGKRCVTNARCTDPLCDDVYETAGNVYWHCGLPAGHDGWHEVHGRRWPHTH